MFCEEGSSETVQTDRLVRALPAYIIVPRSPLSQNMRLGTWAVKKDSGKTLQMWRLVRAITAYRNKCAKITIWASTWDLVHVLWLRLRRDCANVKTCQSHRCLQKCAKIAIWASTWDLVHVLWLRLRQECANVKTCQNLRCLHKLRWNRPTTAHLEVFYSSDYMRFMSPFPCLIMVC